MKRRRVLLACALLLAAACGARAERMLLSDESGPVSAAVCMADEGTVSVRIALDGQLGAAYDRLLDAQTDLSQATLEVFAAGEGWNVPVVCINLGSDPAAGCIRLIQLDGQWTVDLMTGEVDGRVYTVFRELEGYVISLDDPHPVRVPLDAFDQSAAGLSYRGFMRQAAAMKLQAEAEDEQAMLSLMQSAFPEETWADARIVQWDQADGERMTIAAVERGGGISVYWVDDRRQYPERIRIDLGVRPRSVRLFAPFVGSDKERAEVCLELEDGVSCGFSLTPGGDAGAQVKGVWRTGRDEQYWEANLHGTQMEIYPGGLLPGGIPLLAAMDESIRDPATFDLCRALEIMDEAYAGYLNGEPPVIPAADAACAIPQPCGAKLKKGVYPVYTGPGKAYEREAGGKARVSAGDWVQVFGRDGRWALIQYRVSGSHLRFGYVYRDAVEDVDSIPELRLEHAPLRQDNEFVTSDPLGACGRVELTGGVYEMTRLAMLGDRWMYVELTLPNGKPARMFAETEPSHG